MNFLIAIGATFIGLLILVPMFFALIRAFGIYTIVEEGRCHVYVLFGKVLAVLDEPGIYFLWLKLGLAAPIVNWASDKDNKPVRALMEKTVGIDAKATLPKFHSRTFVSAAKHQPGTINQAAPAFGKRRCALYATCFVNYNKPETGMDARAVLFILVVVSLV